MHDATSRAALIEERLRAAWPAAEIEIIDESHQHAGHAGHSGSGESHFRVRINAPDLGAMSRVARHRAVHAALGPDLVGQIHALALEISA